MKIRQRTARAVVGATLLSATLSRSSAPPHRRRRLQRSGGQKAFLARRSIGLTKRNLKHPIGPSVAIAEGGGLNVAAVWSSGHQASNRAGPAFHSITSSARARSVGGTLRPCALAVLRRQS